LWFNVLDVNLLSEIEVTDTTESGTVHMLVLYVHGTMLAGCKRLTTDVALVLDPIHVHDLKHVMAGKLFEKQRFFKTLIIMTEA
jgi:hypothetical protein